MKKKVVIGILGTTLDAGYGKSRWSRWRPTPSLFQHDDFLISRYEMLFDRTATKLADFIQQDIKTVSPETKVSYQHITYDDPWDFEEVYSTLHDFSQSYNFKPDQEDYYVHISTGTHVAQICLFILTEARFFPAKLVQSSPSRSKGVDDPEYRIIDLDLSTYDKLTTRFSERKKLDLSFLKSGIKTRNTAFNDMMEEIDHIAQNSNAPILLSGPTGVGKTRLARRIYELKKSRFQVEGEFVELNCATVKGDMAYSSLFGHKKGSFTGAQKDRQGLLAKANKGVLFLDEIGELGLDEQAMLLKALEDKEFLPLGSDAMVRSDFQLMAGTNRELNDDVRQGNFRDDLFARINLWHFKLPSLKERKEDIPPNIQFELENYSKEYQKRVYFNKEAEKRYTDFALHETDWEGNFRDLSASILRMATLAPDGRIGKRVVDREIQRIREKSSYRSDDDSVLSGEFPTLQKVLKVKAIDEMDLFDKMQLEQVLKVCQECSSMAEAGRKLFAESRKAKAVSNDSDRVKKYLAKYGLSWNAITLR